MTNLIKNISIFKAGLLLALPIIGAGLYLIAAGGSEKVSYLTQPVRRGDVVQTVSATGEIGAGELVDIGAQVSGQIEKLYVKIGQKVSKGDLIAEIDSTMQRNVHETNLARLESYTAQLEAAEITLKADNAQYQRELRLAERGTVSQESLEKAEKAYALAKSAVAELKAMIRQTEIALRTAEVNIGYARITAPLTGTIVSLPVKEGQTVNAAMETPIIARIADLAQMEILIQLSEGDITKIEPGMTVTFNILSEPDIRHETTLKSIDPGMTMLSNGTYTGVVASDQAIYYYGRLVVPNEHGKFHMGMSTESTIIVQEAKDILMVPTSGIKKDEGSNYVEVLENHRPQRKAVSIGLSDNIHTEIKSGLTEGEKIILARTSAGDQAAAVVGMFGE